MLLEDNIVPDLRDPARAREDAGLLWSYLSAPGKAPPERIALDIPGRFHVGDGSEFSGVAREFTAQGLRIVGPKIGHVGEWFVGQFDTLGVIEGVVTQTREQSFVVGPVGTPRWLRRLAERLVWRLRREAEEVVERRTSARVETNAETTLQTDSGQSYPCRIFNLSEGGAALSLGANALYFWVDQPVVFADRPARVLRQFPGGVVIRYEGDLAVI